MRKEEEGPVGISRSQWESRGPKPLWTTWAAQLEMAPKTESIALQEQTELARGWVRTYALI